MDLPTLGYKLNMSVFLARLFAFYILIMVTAMITRKDHFKAFVEDFMQSDGLVTVCAAFTIIFGLVLVLLHNHWVHDWRLLVTIICWWTLLKGCILLFFPTPFSDKARTVLESNSPYYATVVINLVIAFFLLWKATSDWNVFEWFV